MTNLSNFNGEVISFYDESGKFLLKTKNLSLVKLDNDVGYFIDDKLGNITSSLINQSYVKIYDRFRLIVNVKHNDDIGLIMVVR